MNPKTKVFLNGKPVHFVKRNKRTGEYQKPSLISRIWAWFSTTRLYHWLYTAIRTSLIATAITGAFALSFLFGEAYNEFKSSNTISVAFADTMPPHETMAAIMQRIADCESGNGKAGTGSQLNKNGQVVININTNGTVDIGKYQINSIHEKEATALGDDLFTEQGNTAYAKWLYANKGTGDWASSQHCWAR